ncbi:MAG: bifunctional diaminohydroxyphosphoribosylaminopyrimidine deaminase/5-amino-6-(5-phosphoribosylamino)uracil reductase RibD [Candidatus Margulisbacteria bacterium]|jgi:diaminohydroxyphosphoribosylaminopyrimidine deaminase/5-amino-6-(5-phosphoribosylamino)uracil reductase|nr:bifunctional diaminohydroxyphosphoribosylaminopyrimidine deaminase/5-amino-6-(5-phosphoribosylamino)uracil reductase RibD [Candidatus Margulisiibacteriota bacterium]
MQNQDEFFMRRAFELARKGTGYVSPNPLVGAVIVKGGKIIAEGYHRACGKNHAEREAILNLAGKNPIKNCARGAALYVSLEPCAHHGRTPPCTDIIIEAGIKKVVFAVRDPDPQVHGLDPARLLKKAGLEVVYPVLEAEARELNKVFFHNQTAGLPYITLKSAVTLDGKIADARGRSKWITGPEARAAGQRLRLAHDAVLVGKNTVLQDDPRLNIRLPGIKKENYKIVLGARGDFPRGVKLLNDPQALFLGDIAKGLPAQGNIHSAAALKKALRFLYRKFQICSILVEGGAAVNTAFLKSGLVNEWRLFIAPKILGGGALPVFGELGINKLSEFYHAKICSVQEIGGDLLLKILF